jgi:tetratricopeptide (TPR) repeat protein
VTVRVFVSYRRDDSKHAAGRLEERLNERFKLFMDVDQIQGGALFPAVVRKALNEADVLLAVIGSQWLSLSAENGGRRIDQPGDWVAVEIGTALQRGTPVVPVLVDGALMPGRDELPPALADLPNRQAMRIAHESFGTDSERLIDTIQGIVGAVKPEPVNLWEDPDYPQARGAFLQGLWPAAIEGFERVLHRHPRHRQVVEQLEEARRKQNLLDLDAAAEDAAQAERWREAVDNLKALDALQPSDEVKDRLAEAQLRLRITELQNDVRALANTGNWKAVLAADGELARLDPQAGDLDGLATKARAELLDADLAASYAKGVEQLDEHDWAGAEATFGALLDRQVRYRDAEGLLELARCKGKPEEELEPPAQPPASKPVATDSAILRGEAYLISGRLATPNGNATGGAGPPRLVIHEVEDSHGEVGRLAKPTVQRRDKFDSPLVPVIGIVVAILLILIIMAAVNSTGGNKPNSTTERSAVTPNTTPAPSTKSSLTIKQRQLLLEVPESFASTCKPLNITDSRLQPKLVAAIRCDPGSSGMPDYLDYLLYPTKSATESAFDRYVVNPRYGDCETAHGGIYWPGPYNSRGKIACFKRGSVRLLVWDDFDLHIIYRAGSQTMSYEELSGWWTEGGYVAW